MVAGLREIMEVDPHSANGVVTARSLQGAQRYAFKLTARPAAKKKRTETHTSKTRALFERHCWAMQDHAIAAVGGLFTKEVLLKN